MALTVLAVRMATPRAFLTFSFAISLVSLPLLSIGAPSGRTTAEVPEAIGFDRLSGFPYTIVDAGTGATTEQIAAAQKNDQLPAAIRALDGRRVAVTGFMLPVQMENGRARKLVLMRDVTTCCYGATPNMNDYVVVTMRGEGIKAVQDIPVVLIGVLHVAQTYENGYLVSLYTLDGEEYLGPRK